MKLALATRTKRELVIVCWECRRIDEHVNWDTILVSNMFEGGTGGGGRVNMGGGGSRDIMSNNEYH